MTNRIPSLGVGGLGIDRIPGLGTEGGRLFDLGGIHLLISSGWMLFLDMVSDVFFCLFCFLLDLNKFP